MGAGPDEAGPARSRAARGPSFCLARAALRPPPSWIPSRKTAAKKARQLPLAVSIKVNPLSLPAKTRRAVMLLSRVKNAGTELRRDAEREKRNLHSKEGNTAEQNLGEMPGKAKIMNLKNCKYMGNAEFKERQGAFEFLCARAYALLTTFRAASKAGENFSSSPAQSQRN